jgi:uncharacterized membrane protein
MAGLPSDRAIIVGMAPERPRPDTQSRARRGQKLEPAVAAPSDFLVLALAIAGFAVAGYLTWLKWSGKGAVFCVAGSGCDIVQASRYAMFLGVPTAFWGAVIYAAIAGLAGLGFTTSRWLAAFVLAAAGVGFSLYLTVLSLFVLGGACIYCLTSGAILVALVVALMWRRPPASGRRSPLRPVRLATYGTAAAIGAIVFGAFVFAAPSAGPPEYQVALARHLKQTGAIMYGAWW